MRLDIIGSVASGKSTLSRKISDVYHIPHYEKDNIVWMRTSAGDRKRSDVERDALFYDIISKKDWIVEGSPRDCLKESFTLCDYIILLDIPFGLRLYRVFCRWIRQNMGLESYNTKPTLHFLWMNIKWVREFDQVKGELLAELQSYGDKLKVFSSSKEVLNL